MKRQIEVFTAGCPICSPVVAMVKEVTGTSGDIIIHNLNEEFDNQEVKDKLAGYGVNRIPAVAVNGELLGCCTNNEVSRQELIDSLAKQTLN